MPGMHDLDQGSIHANCLGSPTLLSYDDSYWDIGGQEREGMSLHLAFHKGKQVECVCADEWVPQAQHSSYSVLARSSRPPPKSI